LTPFYIANLIALTNFTFRELPIPIIHANFIAKACHPNRQLKKIFPTTQ
jgi:hypothetical protein